MESCAAVKATKEALSPTRVKVTIEVPFEELSDDLASAYKRIASQIRVPGFRPGKVPARIVDQRIGRGYVLNEALPGALDRFYGQALEQEQIAAISSPEDVDVKEFNDGEQLVFTRRGRRPARGHASRSRRRSRSRVDDVKVTDEDVDEQIEGLRDRFATLQPVERAVAGRRLPDHRPVGQHRRRARPRLRVQGDVVPGRLGKPDRGPRRRRARGERGRGAHRSRPS